MNLHKMRSIFYSFDFHSNHTETSFVYLLRSFKSRTSFSEPLRFFDVLTPLADDIFSSSHFSFVVSTSVASISLLVFFSMRSHFVLDFSIEIPSLATEFLLCQKSSFEHRQQRCTVSSMNGDSLVMGETISGS